MSDARSTVPDMPTTTRDSLLLGITDTGSALQQRLQGLSSDEYLWQPVPGCWTVRPTGHGPDGGWTVDYADPAPEPAPVTTIAWRLWHIASDCLATYVTPHLGPWPLRTRNGSTQWHGDPATALAELDRSLEVFTERIRELGEAGVWRQLGPSWGPFAESTWADLVVHALHELAHHGAEIALLRDLYLRAPDGLPSSAQTASSSPAGSGTSPSSAITPTTA
jgi:hypothetical protein